MESVYLFIGCGSGLLLGGTVVYYLPDLKRIMRREGPPDNSIPMGPVNPTRASRANTTSTTNDQHEMGEHAQLILENIYRDIDNIWKRSVQFRGTRRLNNPFVDAQSWPAIVRRRYKDAQEYLGLVYLVILMHSFTFMQQLKSGNSARNQRIYGLLLRKVKDNDESIRLFAIARESHWFDSYQTSPLPEWMGQLPSLENCDHPNVRHPHELYKAPNGIIRRHIFKDSYGFSTPMKTISENLYSLTHWSNPGAKPRSWPLLLDWPADPSRCSQYESGGYPRCSICTEYIQPLSRCACVPIAEYTNPLVEVIRVDESGSNYRTGIRALSPIFNGEYIGEFVGELIPLNRQTEAAFADEQYCTNWYPQYELDDSGRRVTFQEGPNPIANLISGLNGNWTKFLYQGSGENRNVTITQKVIGRRVRLVVQAIKDISFGEELMADN